MNTRYAILGVFAAIIVFAGYQSRTTAGEEKPMTTEANCNESAVARSRCMIDAVLDDIAKTYDQTGGGGIKEIKLIATNTYRVSIAQEGRADEFTYEVSVSEDGAVSIDSREESTKSYGD